jgi:hypothetical protein
MSIIVGSKKSQPSGATTWSDVPDAGDTQIGKVYCRQLVVSDIPSQAGPCPTVSVLFPCSTVPLCHCFVCIGQTPNRPRHMQNKSHATAPDVSWCPRRRENPPSPAARRPPDFSRLGFVFPSLPIGQSYKFYPLNPTSLPTYLLHSCYLIPPTSTSWRIPA